MAHEFEVSGNDLDAGGKSQDFVVRAAWVRGMLEGTDATSDGSDGTLSLRLSKSDEDVVVHGQLKVTLSSHCARCTKPVTLPIDQEVTALFVPAVKLPGSGKDGPDEYEFSSDEADTLPYDGETVVLDDLIRDEMLLEIPMIPLCSEDCPGRAHSPQGSTDLPGERPVDPRLAVLKDFVISTGPQAGKPTKPSKKPSK